MAYPSLISTLATPQPTDRLNSPSHSTLHQNENTAITEIETFVGTLSSAVGTLVYDIRSSNSDGGGHVQVANKGGTGQTSFTKGDLLIASSSSVLTKFAVGTDGLVLVADSTKSTGVKWGSSAQPITTQYTSGISIWRKSSTLTYAVIEVQGGGGGGGAGNTNQVGGGGGGGGFSREIVTAANLPLAASVIVAASVAGGTAAGAGTSGNPTFFGSILNATGGAGGSAAAGNASGGSGGSGSGGDLNVTGSGGGGGFGNVTLRIAGTGGGAYYGGGAIGQGGDNAGGDGGVYGGGGGGGGGANSGGKGAPGIVIITEY